MEGQFRPAPWIDRFYVPLYIRYQRFMKSQGHLYAEIRDFLSRCPQAPVLDLACGPGLESGLINGRSSVGVDASFPSLKIARRVHPTRAFLQADVVQLPFADASFGGILGVGLLHHLPDVAVRSVIGELVRILRPDGKALFLEVTFPAHPANILGHLLAHLDRGRFVRQPDAYVRMLEQGFNVVRQTVIPERSVHYCSLWLDMRKGS